MAGFCSTRRRTNNSLCLAPLLLQMGYLRRALVKSWQSSFVYANSSRDEFDTKLVCMQVNTTTLHPVPEDCCALLVRSIIGRPRTGNCREVQLDHSSVHFPMRLSDFDLWTVEKRLLQCLFHFLLTALRALTAMKADQTDNFITNLCIQCRVMSAPASHGLILDA